VYLKIDQVMLKHMAGNSEVGVYSVAVSFSEASYFIPIAIANSFFPKLIAEREQSELKYEESLLNLLRLLLGFSILLIGAVWLLSGPMIGLVMSEEFSSVEYLLKIHVLATLFIFLRALVSKWIILEGLYKFSAISQGGGALLNVILNLLLIPHYGATGAAWATVLSYGFASYFVFFFFKETRYIFDKLTQTYFLRKMIK
jgi:O-antigen/teichoic acid export membrane protein